MKILKIMGIIALVILAYIILGFTHSAQQQIVTSASASINASANMSNIPGTLEVVDAWPTLVWFVPGIVGLGVSVWILLKPEK